MANDLEEGEHDLGNGVYFRWLSFAPDRELNPHLSHLEDNDRTGIIVGHFHEEGTCARHDTPEACAKNPDWCSNRCEGGVLFDTPENSRPGANQPTWQVHSLDPLHIEPSVFMNPDRGGCGLHGFIRGGRWINA